MALRPSTLFCVFSVTFMFWIPAITADGVNGTIMDVELDQHYLTDEYDCEAKVGNFCGPDCRSLTTCLGPHGFRNQNCGKIDRKTRYCVGRMCSDSPDETNDRCLMDTFWCTSTGVFPDPHDCTTYYDCDDQHATPVKYKCPSNLVFSSELELCVDASKYGCHLLECSADQFNTFIPFNKNPNFYGFCGFPIILYKCADGHYYDSNENDCMPGEKEAINETLIEAPAEEVAESTITTGSTTEANDETIDKTAEPETIAKSAGKGRKTKSSKKIY